MRGATWGDRGQGEYWGEGGRPVRGPVRRATGGDRGATGGDRGQGEYWGEGVDR